jgi:ketosteroid isomerase-like protein
VSLDNSIALVRQYLDALNAGELGALDQLFADDFVIRRPSGELGRRATVPELQLYRVVDGKITERWYAADRRAARGETQARLKTRWRCHYRRPFAARTQKRGVSLQTRRN